jgi:dihydrofolate reductase
VEFVEFVNDEIAPFLSRPREQPGKDIWLIGGGEIIASFLDAQWIDEFVISVAPFHWGGHPIDRAASSSPALGVASRRTD